MHNFSPVTNIHAGFDETSSLLGDRFPASEMEVFDFYDPGKHTEISIKRARRACLPHPGTQKFQTSHIPIADASVDIVFLLFSAHEIRSDAERVSFLLEIKRVLTPGGVIIVTEHLRDLPNFLAYSFGFFHFLSLATWEETFEGAEISITGTTKITPFVTGFLLS